MIYSDGAGAVILEAKEGSTKEGILSFSSRTYAELSDLLTIGPSNNPDYADKDARFLKMQGHELYKAAVKLVPEVMKDAIKKAGITLAQLKLIGIHQANETLDYSILEKMGLSQEQIKKLTPMTISWLGNSSVATLPTLLDLILRGQMPDYKLESGDLVAFASVGAGFNINAAVYRMPNY